MNTKSKLSIFTSVATAIITFACLGSAPATGIPVESTEAPVISTAKDGKLEITSTNSYVDSFNDFNVVGEIVNNTNDTLEHITLSLSIMDETGASLLKDENDNPVEHLEIEPYITVLAPGASTPFNYYISADEVQPAAFEVTLKNHDTSSEPVIQEFDIQNIQVNTVAGDVFVTGEVVNLSSEHIDVQALAGAVMNNEGNILAANSTLTYAHYLYPTGDSAGRDRGPFIIKFFGPIQDVANWKVYARPVANSIAPSADVNIQLADSYFDQYGTYHLLGNITNNGEDQISPSVIGGLHNPDKSVLDTASLNIPMYLNPGETIPFDIYTFQVIGTQSSEIASSAETIVKPDLYWTFTTENETVALEQIAVKVTKGDFTWSASGTVINTSGGELSNITAVIQCVDANGQLIVINYASIYPAENTTSIQPGAVSEFSVDLYPPAETENLNNCSASFQGISVP